MKPSAAPRIEPAIRDHLAPLLRKDGFSGSGRTFRRTGGGWIHVVNVQGSRYGGQFAVNLALQPVSIPDLRGNTPDPKRITEDLCEFRRRLSDYFERQDMWWLHEYTAESMAAAVRAAASSYDKIGRALLNDATAEASDLNTVTPAAFAAGVFDFRGFGSTKCRMAFALARLRKAQGRNADAREFAEQALNQMGPAVGLKVAIQAFLKQHDV
jgi:hypothetical protein